MFICPILTFGRKVSSVGCEGGQKEQDHGGGQCLFVLVNNAGYGSSGALENVPLDEARRQFEVYSASLY